MSCRTPWLALVVVVVLGLAAPVSWAQDYSVQEELYEEDPIQEPQEEESQDEEPSDLENQIDQLQQSSSVRLSRSSKTA